MKVQYNYKGKRSRKVYGCGNNVLDVQNMANNSVKRKLGWKMRSKAGMVDTNTNRHVPISTEVPRHLQNS
jgi:hypothetical protein